MTPGAKGEREGVSGILRGKKGSSVVVQGARRTERVPQYQSKLWNLLTLLAEFQKSLLAGRLAQ